MSALLPRVCAVGLNLPEFRSSTAPQEQLFHRFCEG